MEVRKCGEYLTFSGDPEPCQDVRHRTVWLMPGSLIGLAPPSDEGGDPWVGTLHGVQALAACPSSCLIKR